jgi:hypothetical protein
MTIYTRVQWIHVTTNGVDVSNTRVWTRALFVVDDDEMNVDGDECVDVNLLLMGFCI